jgi:hypothetical protein
MEGFNFGDIIYSKHTGGNLTEGRSYKVLPSEYMPDSPGQGVLVVNDRGLDRLYPSCLFHTQEVARNMRLEKLL